MRIHRHAWLAALAIGLLFAARNIVVATGGGHPIPWVPGVALEILYWLTWALLAPAIVALIARLHAAGRIAAIGLLGLVVAPLQTAIDIVAALSAARWVFREPEEEIARRMEAFPRILAAESFSGLLVYAAIAGAYFAAHYYQNYRNRERELAHAELRALRAQLNPHFLFNTLHTISVLIHQDREAAQRMLIGLSDLLRIAVRDVHAQEVALEQEVTFIRKYLEIERTRHGGRLDAVIDVDRGAANALVPSLLLQPLVENAIRHGLERTMRPCTIALKAAREDGMLRVRVSDDGAGAELAPQLWERGRGLASTRARLQLLYGERQSMDVRTKPGSGFAVDIALPLHQEAAR